MFVSITSLGEETAVVGDIIVCVAERGLVIGSCSLLVDSELDSEVELVTCRFVGSELPDGVFNLVPLVVGIILVSTLMVLFGRVLGVEESTSSLE